MTVEQLLNASIWGVVLLWVHWLVIQMIFDYLHRKDQKKGIVEIPYNLNYKPLFENVLTLRFMGFPCSLLATFMLDNVNLMGPPLVMAFGWLMASPMLLIPLGSLMLGHSMVDAFKEHVKVSALPMHQEIALETVGWVMIISGWYFW